MERVLPDTASPIALTGFHADEKLLRTFTAKLARLGLRTVEYRPSAKAKPQQITVHRLSAFMPHPPAALRRVIRHLEANRDAQLILLCDRATAMSAITASNWRPLLCGTLGIACATSVDQAVVTVVHAVVRRRVVPQLVHPLWRHATPDLQSANGQLNAKKIAQLFGLSQTSLGQMLGVRLQTLNKTPDAESLQRRLRDYQRIARLKMLPNFSDADFRKWLRSPIGALRNRTPLDLLTEKKLELIAELVENALTGQPA